MEEFIKSRMKEEFGLVNNPNPEQFEEIINTREIKKKPKGKTVYFEDFINKISEDSDHIIDAEIIKEAINLKVKNDVKN